MEGSTASLLFITCPALARSATYSPLETPVCNFFPSLPLAAAVRTKTFAQEVRHDTVPRCAVQGGWRMEPPDAVGLLPVSRRGKYNDRFCCGPWLGKRQAGWSVLHSTTTDETTLPDRMPTPNSELSVPLKVGGIYCLVCLRDGFNSALLYTNWRIRPLLVLECILQLRQDGMDFMMSATRKPLTRTSHYCISTSPGVETNKNTVSTTLVSLIHHHSTHEW